MTHDEFSALADITSKYLEIGESIIPLIDSPIHKIKVVNAWDTVHIPKKDRVGKSFEELQAVRKEMYESNK